MTAPDQAPERAFSIGFGQFPTNCLSSKMLGTLDNHAVS